MIYILASLGVIALVYPSIVLISNVVMLIHSIPHMFHMLYIWKEVNRDNYKITRVRCPYHILKKKNAMAIQVANEWDVLYFSNDWMDGWNGQIDIQPIDSFITYYRYENSSFRVEMYVAKTFFVPVFVSYLYRQFDEKMSSILGPVVLMDEL